MGFRSAIRKGGGFLNGVTGTIVDSKVETFESKKGEDMISFRIYVLLDGADAPVDTSLFFGSAEGFVVSDDEKSISAEDGSGIRIGATTGLGIFMDTLLDASPELEERLPNIEEGEALSLVGIHGTRLAFRQRVNDERTKKQGKRKGNDGKEYAQQDLVVETVYDLPKAAGKANGKAAKAASAAKGGKKAAPSNTAVKELAQETLVGILEAQPENSIPKAKVRMKVFSAFGAKHPQRAERDNVISIIYDDAFLAELVEGGFITYDAGDEQQTIALA